MTCSSTTLTMQWQTKGQFTGQVKPVGIGKGMGWKMGFVHFDYDPDTGGWRVRLYFQVNPSQVCQQMKIGQSDQLDVRCGRLIIENKKGDGIHIKLSSRDVTHAKQLVSKIKTLTLTTASSSKAEVGFSNTLGHKELKTDNTLGHKGLKTDSSGLGEDLCLLQGSTVVSPHQQSIPWLSTHTPPTKGSQHHAAPKRKLELCSPERLDIPDLEKDYPSSQRFTGMKDYSKRNLHGGNSLSVSNGLGPKSFYGTQKPSTINCAERNTQINSSSHSRHQTPALKRPKLTSLCSTIDRGRMVRVRQSQSNTSALAEAHALSIPRDNLLQVVAGPPKHHVKDGQTVGFENLGNTCFLNAPLQCLSALEPLTLDIQSAVAQFRKEIKPDSLTRKLYVLMKDVRRPHVCPEHIKELLMKLRLDMNFKFAPNTQQDAHELLSELLNRIDEEVKAAMRLYARRLSVSTQESAGREAPDAGSQVSLLDRSRLEESALPSLMPTPTESNFCWSYQTCIYFHECKTEIVSSQMEREMTLMLALDSSMKNLQDCIHKYFEKTDVEMKCSKCGREEKATITRKIVRRPRVLILNLLRYHSDNVESTKKADHVHVPGYISIGEYCAGDVIGPAHIDPVLLLDRNEQFAVYTCHCDPDSSSRTQSPDGLLNVTDDLDIINDLSDHEQTVPAFDVKRPAENSRIPCQAVAPSLRFDPSTSLDMAEYFNSPEDLSQHSARTMFAPKYVVSTDSFAASLSQTRHMLLACASSVQVPNASDKDLQKSSTSPVAVFGSYQDSHSDNSSESDDLVNRLADLVSCSLRCAESYVEDAHERGEDISAIYATAQTVISRLKSSITRALQSDHFVSDFQDSDDLKSCDVFLSEILLKKASMLDEKLLDSLPEDTLMLVMEGLLASRYDCTARRQKNINNLIEDLGLCVAAAESGLVKSGGQEWTAAIANFRKVWQRCLGQKMSATNTKRGSPDGGSDLDVGSDTVYGSHVMVEDDIFFKRMGPLKVQQIDKTSDETTKHTDLSVDVWSDAAWGDDDDRQPQQSLLLQASYHMSPDSSCYLLQGRHVSSFTEADLQNIDPASLSEDEMMVYAQALSRIAYEKEQAPVFGNCASGELLGTCNSSEKLPDGSQQSDAGSVNLQSCSGQNSTGKMISSHGAGSANLQSCSGQDSSGKMPSSHGAGSELAVPESGSGLSPANCDQPLCGKVSGKSDNPSPLGHKCAERIMSTEADTSSAGQVLTVAVGGRVHSSVAALKKGVLFSPPKTNNLVKSRDYARLRSPSVSPKKRMSKGPSPTYSVSKRLHYSEKGSGLHHGRADTGEGSDDSNSEPHNTSMEVNIDDMSFFDCQQSSMGLTTDSRDHRSTPASMCSTPRNRHAAPAQTPVDDDLPNTCCASTPVVEGPHPSLPAMYLSPMQTELLDSSEQTFGHTRVAASQGLHSMQPDFTVMPSRKLVRPVATYIPDIEEKENVHQDNCYISNLRNMANSGRRDNLSYKLVSVVDHAGSSQFTGHYTAYAFNMSRQKWFQLDDTETLMVTEETVREATTQSGYLFFYMDKDLFDEYSSKNIPSVTVSRS